MRRWALAVVALWDRLQGRLAAGLAWALASPAPPPVAAAPRKILVLRPDDAGDNVLNLAFVQGLRKIFPRAEIWVAVKPGLMGLLQGQGMDGCLPAALPARRLLRFPLAAWQGWRQGRRWRPLGFDACFMPRFGPDYHGAAWAAWAAGIPRREAFGDASLERARLDPGLWRLLTKAWTSPAGARHELLRLYDALGQLASKAPRPVPSLALPVSERQSLRKALRGQGWDGRQPLVVLGLDASHMRRAWPLEKFVELTAAFPGVGWILQAGPGRAGLVRSLQAALPGFSLDASAFSLRQLAACMASCRAYVGADTGPKHIALALGLPVLEIACNAIGTDPMNSCAPERFGPWRPGSKVLRPRHPLAPCTGACQAGAAHCITQVSSASAITALRSFLPRGSAEAKKARRP